MNESKSNTPEQFADTAKAAFTVPPDELAELLQRTNFTATEIANFYKSTATGTTTTIDKRTFASVCLQNDIKNAVLIDRMWHIFDRNHDGALTQYELVLALNPLLRGTPDEVAATFFELYDLNRDGELTAAELVAVYSDLIAYNQTDPAAGLTAAQKKRIREWVATCEERSSGRVLDRQTFLAEVRRMREEAETGGDGAGVSLLSWRTVIYVFLVSWFEVGTSFCLPAMGALSDRIKARFDVGDQEIGTLTSAYFFAAMIGPLIGGLFMDKYGPGIVIICANTVVVIGACFQAIADGEDQFALLVVGRLLLGLGGEITPFTTIEILGRLFPDHLGLMVCTVSQV